MHLTGFCSEVNEMEKNLSSAIELQCFFQTTESSLEMKAIKKKTYSNLDLCCLCFC